MEYYEKENSVVLKNVKNFNIEEILECGQCFRFEKIENLKYKIVAYGNVLYITQTEDSVEFTPCNKEDFENIWYDYFDLDTDYNNIIEEISKNDPIMKSATEYADGIRLLNQEPYECLLSFIISQNNNIPRIKKIIKAMAETYGKSLGSYINAVNQGWGGMAETYGKSLGDEYAFPRLEEIENATVEDLMELRMGFRAKYIFDCISKLKNGEVDLSKANTLNTDDLRKELISIKGVGQKVADCVLLFSLKRRETFPTDVWIKRVMEHLYFNDEEKDIKEIHAYAQEKWGKYCGYAQQYLFYYARSLKIGTDKEKKK